MTLCMAVKAPDEYRLGYPPKVVSQEAITGCDMSSVMRLGTSHADGHDTLVVETSIEHVKNTKQQG